MCALKRRFGSLKWPDSNLKPDYIAKSACQLDFQVPERQERFAIAARQFFLSKHGSLPIFAGKHERTDCF